MIAQQSLECGAPVPLWIWYDVANIQPMPEYSSFKAEPKRRRVAALQSQALPDESRKVGGLPGIANLRIGRLLCISLGH